MTAALWLTVATSLTAFGQTTLTPDNDQAPTDRIAVMQLKAAGAPEEYVEGVTETIATVVSDTGVFETISPRQVGSLLAYEKRRELLGGCVDEACYTQVARLVKARYVIAGSVVRVDKRLVLNLVLIDAEAGNALDRTNRETEDSATLLSEVRHAAIVLLQPLLSTRQGYLKVNANVPDVELVVDDTLRLEKAGQVMGLAAGPHVLEVRREGFYSASADLFVRPSHVRVENVNLIPAKETIENYESTARLMRYSAYGSAAVAVVSGVLSGVFFAQATEDKNLVDSYSQARAIDRPMIGSRSEAVAAEDSFATHQALYISMLTTAVIAGGLSLYLFIAGDDPDRYAEFRSLAGVD